MAVPCVRQLQLLRHLQEAVDIGLDALRRSAHAATTFDNQAALSAVQRCGFPPDGVVLGCFRGDRITAAIAMQVQPYFWVNPRKGERFATDLFFASVRPGDGLRVLRAAVDWAFRQPRVIECTFAVSSGGDSWGYDALYERVGAKRLGGMYQVRK